MYFGSPRPQDTMVPMDLDSYNHLCTDSWNYMGTRSNATIPTAAFDVQREISNAITDPKQRIATIAVRIFGMEIIGVGVGVGVV